MTTLAWVSLITTGFTILLWITPKYVAWIPLKISGHPYLDGQIRYQAAAMVWACVALVLAFAFDPLVFKQYSRLGSPAAPAEALELFGIQKGDSWLETGVSLSIIISLATGSFMYASLKKVDTDWSIHRKTLGWVLLFSLTNSFIEEAIYRIALLVPLVETSPPHLIYLVSAVIFGSAHVRGMPNGVLGVVMSGVLGYVLAKSVMETQGFFWAWWIHFLQDVLIMSALSMVTPTSTPSPKV